MVMFIKIILKLTPYTCIVKILQGGFFQEVRDRHEFKNFTKINLWCDKFDKN